ncbi:hypothetical protein SNOG_00905 [Parastagonospora nodorum SN15]|uniref:Uncharacterized protein n=1 Tax=Phaeosphaeria nodorum (strain SN15 / ATCC MYA-4574 / FGSC 10173) TaxID=321614 RepID=Q0V509_PHANO|nr:hypothetical protein SNOG_00905 [Parastagonospora nodorum SN15]EAT92400.2 hypothetical protein SNOG_00905 [Parastagonospora nodorum SN15]
MTAAGLSGSYDLRSDDYGTLQPGGKDRAAISLSTLFRVSKNITDHLQTHIYHSTDFHFGLTGFTNFLWQSGPEKRHEIRRLTFHFGKLALLHCIRWLAPDAIFLLFEPPVATNPRSLQYFWRCQIQDLVKDLHLFTLTVDIKQIDRTDLPMMIAIMKSAFGSIEKLRFVETDNKGITTPVTLDDKRLSELRKKHTWRQMCLEYYEAHRVHSYFYKFELLKGQVEDLEAIMAKENTFFNTPFSPLVPREEFPAHARISRTLFFAASRVHRGTSEYSSIGVSSSSCSCFATSSSLLVDAVDVVEVFARSNQPRWGGEGVREGDVWAFTGSNWIFLGRSLESHEVVCDEAPEDVDVDEGVGEGEDGVWDVRLNMSIVLLLGLLMDFEI